MIPVFFVTGFFVPVGVFATSISPTSINFRGGLTPVITCNNPSNATTAYINGILISDGNNEPCGATYFTHDILAEVNNEANYFDVYGYPVTIIFAEFSQYTTDCAYYGNNIDFCRASPYYVGETTLTVYPFLTSGNVYLDDPYNPSCLNNSREVMFWDETGGGLFVAGNYISETCSQPTYTWGSVLSAQTWYALEVDSGEPCQALDYYQCLAISYSSSIVTTIAGSTPKAPSGLFPYPEPPVFSGFSTSNVTNDILPYMLGSLSAFVGNNILPVLLIFAGLLGLVFAIRMVIRYITGNVGLQGCEGSGLDSAEELAKNRNVSSEEFGEELKRRKKNRKKNPEDYDKFLWGEE